MPEGIRSRHTAASGENTTESDGATSHGEGGTAWDSAYSLLASGDYLLPTGAAATRRYLYVITASQPSEASGTLERVSGGVMRQSAVMRHG